MLTTLSPYTHLISWSFIALDIVLTLYQFVRLFFNSSERKNWLPFSFLLLLLIFNVVWNWVDDLLILVLVNILSLMVVAFAMVIPLLSQKKRLNLPDNLEKLRTSDEVFVANCTKYNFSTREIQVADLVCKSFKNKQIAEELFISEKTVETHLQNIYAKVGERGKLTLIAKLTQ